MPDPISNLTSNLSPHPSTFETAPAAETRDTERPPSPPPSAPASSVPHPAAVQQLVAGCCQTPPSPPPRCDSEAVDLVKSGGILIASGVGLVATSSFLGAAAMAATFISSATGFAASLAKYENCEDRREQTPPASR